MTTVANSGQAFSTSAFNRFGYDDRNQLTESSRYQGPDVNDLSSPVQPEYRSYAYDSIGNRESATGWDDDVSASKVGTYASNSLNQYAQITTNNPQPTTNSFTYDFDGNLTEISKSTSTVRYRYNAENRLIAVEPQNPVDGSVRLEYTYDYIGRRVKKTFYTYESGIWSLTSDILFLYDGWNLVKEITTDTGQPPTEKYYVWGLDLSQSLQGAGGIGGLLAAVEGSLTHYFYYDGNGNVGQLVNVSDGSISVRYEYDPFGNSIVSNGPAAENNSYRFSTKYFDNEIGLYYYGYRYYSPQLGRWINKDPLEEFGGSNLYGFINNSAVNNIDFLGLLDARCGEDRCCDLKDLTPLLNKHVTDQIRKGIKLFTSIESIRDRLGKDIKHSHSRGLTNIDGWIQDLGDEYRKSDKKKFGITPYRWASCVKLKCDNKERCIGADKISHFFQQGFMLFELYTSDFFKNRSDSERQQLVESFSQWTEGLYNKPKNPTDYQNKIHYFLSKGIFTFHDFGNRSMSSYKNKWGNIGGMGDFISKPSIGDHNANIAGLEFWKKMAEIEGTFGRYNYSFDICKFIKNLDTVVER